MEQKVKLAQELNRKNIAYMLKIGDELIVGVRYGSINNGIGNIVSNDHR